MWMYSLCCEGNQWKWWIENRKCIYLGCNYKYSIMLTTYLNKEVISAADKCEYLLLILLGHTKINSCVMNLVGRGGYSNMYTLSLKLSFLLFKRSSFDHVNIWSPKLRQSTWTDDSVSCFHSWAPPLLPMSTSLPLHVTNAPRPSFFSLFFAPHACINKMGDACGLHHTLPHCLAIHFNMAISSVRSKVLVKCGQKMINRVCHWENTERYN